MSVQDFPYSSQRHFLQEKTQGRRVLQEELAALKAAYRKLYNTHLKRHTRSLRKHLTISMSKKEHAEVVKIARNHQISLTDYVRNASLHIRPQLLPKRELQSLEEKVLSLLDTMEELREELADESESMQALLEQIQLIDTTIQKLLHYDN